MWKKSIYSYNKLKALYTKSPKRIIFLGTIIGCSSGGIYYYYNSSPNNPDNKNRNLIFQNVYAEPAASAPAVTTTGVLPNSLFYHSRRQLPTRAEQIESLQKTEPYDVVVIGGGATGSGIALDAVSRGLSTALIELDDFSSGTSSRSTKLLHGGVRYLQKAILNFDIEQYRMVKEALNERWNLLQIAPHLSSPLPIMLPIYKWWQMPYYWVGIKMYDLVAGRKLLKSSYILSKSRALELFPMLRKDKLVGALVYYDGQHNDARMNISIALTATRMGATIANHVEVVSVIKERDSLGIPRVVGVDCLDHITNERFRVNAKCVINATGPFTDSIRKMDDPSVKNICCPSAGVHIVLPGYYSPEGLGLLDPSTSDGRVIFFLPWQKLTIAGTTDSPCGVTHHPAPSEKDIQFILGEVKNYLHPDLEVRRGDVLSAWCGIRPLVSDPNKPSTEALARNHIIHVSPSNLITIAGGKWTTYRSMAEETIDRAIETCNLKPIRPSSTNGLLLEGSHGWSPTLFIRLVQDVGLEPEVARHLSNTYGDRAFSVAKLGSLTGKKWPVVGIRLHSEFPYIDAEVRYAIREYACTAVDVIARRLRLSFLNVAAAEESLPEIIEIMGEELKWSEEEKKRQHNLALEFLNLEMGSSINKRSKQTNYSQNLSKEEVQIYTKRFKSLDAEGKGYISVNDLRRGLQRHGESVPGSVLHDILREIDTNHNGTVELEEYLETMSAIKSGTIVNSRFARMVEMEEERLRERPKISVERSGGGL